MGTSEIDIPLNRDEQEEKISLLKKHDFGDFEIHPYRGFEKHKVTLKEIRSTYYKFDKIIQVFKRPAKQGYKYSFRYRLERQKTLILCFFLDEHPPKFFNAYYDYAKQERKLRKKMQKWLKREFFNKNK